MKVHALNNTGVLLAGEAAPWGAVRWHSGGTTHAPSAHTHTHILRTTPTHPERGTSPDGHDLSFATNTLGGLALAQRLLPALQRAAGSRVVFVSSGGMYMGECF